MGESLNAAEMLILLYRTGRARLVQRPRTSKRQSPLPRPIIIPSPLGVCGHMGLEPRLQADKQEVRIIHSKSRQHGAKEATPCWGG